MAINAFWLEDWTVSVLHIGETEIIADATYDQQMMNCPKCGAVGPVSTARSS